jgi:hypothetical protein
LPADDVRCAIYNSNRVSVAMHYIIGSSIKHDPEHTLDKRQEVFHDLVLRPNVNCVLNAGQHSRGAVIQSMEVCE